MRVLVLSVCAFALAAAQWSAPISLPTDSGTGLIPAVAAMSDSNLFCAWVAGYAGGQEHQILGSMYDAVSGAWNSPIQFTQRSALVSAIGPGLSADPAHGGLRVAYYRGSFPTDEDTWGIYGMFADSTGVGPDQRVMADTAVEIVIMRFNEAGQVGMMWTDETGAGLDMYSSVWFSLMSGDT